MCAGWTCEGHPDGSGRRIGAGERPKEGNCADEDDHGEAELPGAGTHRSAEECVAAQTIGLPECSAHRDRRSRGLSRITQRSASKFTPTNTMVMSIAIASTVASSRAATALVSAVPNP